MPLPDGRLGSYSILAHVRPQATIIYLNGQGRFDLAVYNDLTEETKKVRLTLTSLLRGR